MCVGKRSHGYPDQSHSRCRSTSLRSNTINSQIRFSNPLSYDLPIRHATAVANHRTQLGPISVIRSLHLQVIRNHPAASFVSLLVYAKCGNNEREGQRKARTSMKSIGVWVAGPSCITLFPGAFYIKNRLEQRQLYMHSAWCKADWMVIIVSLVQA